MRGEFELIERIRATLGKPSARVDVGIGDDCAVVAPPKGKLLTTVDMLVEGVHFNLEWLDPEELGHRALAVNLSDIAAMGGRALYALVSLGVGDSRPEEIEAIYRGMGALARKHGVDIVGGNITRLPGRLCIDISVIGEPVGEVYTRAGARVGDIVGVSGPLGGAAAGLGALLKDGRAAREKFPRETRAHLLPTPRMDLAGIAGVTSAIDISDGLASELHHLARASGVGFRIDAEKIPAATDVEEWVLYGGEDYELLMTFTPRKVPAGVTPIGVVTEAREGLSFADGRPIEDRGWDHLPVSPEA